MPDSENISSGGVCICACRNYHRIPGAAVQSVQSACRAAGIPCIVVPDLCRIAAKDRAALAGLASCSVILACQTRAVKALFGTDAAPNKILDIRSIAPETLLETLSLKPGTCMETQASNAAPVSDSWIPWFPVIDETRCVNCGRCADFCLFGVYEKLDGTVRVVHPESCKTDCPACARICPANAVIFPKSEEPRLNGSLVEKVSPSESDHAAFRERLLARSKARKIPRLFKED